MSLIYDIEKLDEKLQRIIERYEEDLKDVEKHIQISGKTLFQANEEQAAWQLFYDQRRIELYSLVKWYRMEVDKVRGILFSDISFNNNLGLTDKAKNQFIDKDKKYLSKKRLLIEIEELYERYAVVVTAFNSRAYALNNITKLKVNSLENESL
jgi:hypothetical protein